LSWRPGATGSDRERPAAVQKTGFFGVVGMAKTALTDQPNISRKEAAVFFNVGIDIFFKRWESHHRFNIRHVKTTKGLRLSLTDVIEAAFPKATEQTVHMMAYTYLQDVHQRRCAKQINRKKDDDEGGSES